MEHPDLLSQRELPRPKRGRSFLLHSPRLLSHLQGADCSSKQFSPRVHRLFRSVFLIPRSGYPIPTFILFLFLGCFHLFIEDPKSFDQDIDRSVFITVMLCSTDRTDPGMYVQVLNVLVLVSADVT